MARWRSRPGQALGKITGRDHTHLAEMREDEKIRFRDIQAQPRKIISSPTWSGIESEHVSYTAGYTNVHELIPWRTLTGRQQFYQDHRWFRDFGESACGLSAADRYAHRAEMLGKHSNGEKRDRAQLHHAASEMGHPFDLYRQSADADVVARRADRVALGDRCEDRPTSSTMTGSSSST